MNLVQHRGEKLTIIARELQHRCRFIGTALQETKQTSKTHPIKHLIKPEIFTATLKKKKKKQIVKEGKTSLEHILKSHTFPNTKTTQHDIVTLDHSRQSKSEFCSFWK